ncbi:hypothetical protein OG596_02045 [Streptomyces sp. NBC_01102]|uniref:hypothetical protein n=1 Tax=unclassified Streptomyces TaxID=2593676 RepID=UPI0038630955|nr:hypothetical protein OG596_02045 [Streptomyces sp. NBC_01102]
MLVIEEGLTASFCRRWDSGDLRDRRDSKVDIDELRRGLKKVLTYGNSLKVPVMNLT